MPERRYDDDEIREILSRATELRHDTPALPAGSGDVGGHGLTLAEPKDAEGSLQARSNGHLKVLLEPLPEGARLRFQSRHDASRRFPGGSGPADPETV